jgi:hypothetical protein
MRGSVVAQADSSAGNASRSFVAQNGSVVLVFTRPTSGFLSSSGFTKVAAAYGRGTVFREHAFKKVCGGHSFRRVHIRAELLRRAPNVTAIEVNFATGQWRAIGGHALPVAHGECGIGSV